MNFGRNIPAEDGFCIVKLRDLMPSDPVGELVGKLPAEIHSHSIRVVALTNRMAKLIDNSYEFMLSVSTLALAHHFGDSLPSFLLADSRLPDVLLHPPAPDSVEQELVRLACEIDNALSANETSDEQHRQLDLLITSGLYSKQVTDALADCEDSFIELYQKRKSSERCPSLNRL